MSQAFGNRTPQEMLESLLLATVVVAAIIGVILWLGGSRFSKTLIPLTLFSIGSSIGIYLPAWFGWNIDGWATSLGAGLVLGASGLFLHRFWVGVGLGGVLAFWAAIVTWHYMADGAVWVWRQPEMPLESLSAVTSIMDVVKALQLREYVMSYWDAVPAAVQHRLPYACGGAMVAGVGLSLMRPRLAMAMMYSMLGVTLLAAGGCYAMSTPNTWAARLPREPFMQVVLLLAMTALGMLVQWQTKAVPRSVAVDEDEEPKKAGKKK